MDIHEKRAARAARAAKAKAAVEKRVSETGSATDQVYLDRKAFERKQLQLLIESRVAQSLIDSGLVDVR